jgi:Cytochrome c554 and c-prime
MNETSPLSGRLVIWGTKMTGLRRLATAVGVAAAVLLLAAAGAMAGPAAIDPAHVVGPTKCVECHKVEALVWQHTHHFASYREIPRDPKAAEIAKKMGLRRIKSESLCLNCHFTNQVKDGKLDPIAGVSCESCHGAGEGFIKVHSGFSGKKKETETAAERTARWQKAEAAGMIRPHMIYRIAKNCYSCHIVPEEKLVNVGGHQAGSPFELVSWTQGEIRHNTWYSDGKSNPEASQNIKRKMYVTGAAVELEESLRAVGKATQNAAYAVTMARRAQAAAQRLGAINGALKLPETQAMMAAAGTAQLNLNNEKQLSGVADKIGAATQEFDKKYDGSQLGAIDSMIPGPATYKGKSSR